MLRHTWQKSTRSGNAANCVEGRTAGTGVQVRDSKDKTGPVLAFGPDAWRAFVQDVKIMTP